MNEETKNLIKEKIEKYTKDQNEMTFKLVWQQQSTDNLKKEIKWTDEQIKKLEENLK